MYDKKLQQLLLKELKRQRNEIVCKLDAEIADLETHPKDFLEKNGAFWTNSDLLGITNLSQP